MMGVFDRNMDDRKISSEKRTKRLLDLSFSSSQMGLLKSLLTRLMILQTGPGSDRRSSIVLRTGLF